MEALRQAMAAKKRELSVIRAEKAAKREKYMRRGDVETILYSKTAENEPKTSAKDSSPRKKRKLSDEPTEKANQEEQNENENHAKDQEMSSTTLSPLEIKRRLRELGHPIALFGESVIDRIQRLKQAQLDYASKQEEELGDGHDDGKRDAADEDDHDDDKHGEDLDDHQQKRREEDATNPNLDEDEDDDSNPSMLVYRFFKKHLRLWERDLANRPDHIKRTAQGKIATKTMKQCKDYIRPLFKLCKHRQVPDDILPNLVDIVKFCREKEFVLANDAYIKLAIGNAAWPIGVTMVGIHERTGREKINSNKQAHVMNNEAQRKYLTSVKRLISYCQSIADVLPSKKVA